VASFVKTRSRRPAPTPPRTLAEFSPSSGLRNPEADVYRHDLSDGHWHEPAQILNIIDGPGRDRAVTVTAAAAAPRPGPG
jgi:hypothetical protein